MSNLPSALERFFGPVTTTNADLVVPAVGSTVVVGIDRTSGMLIGSWVFVEGAGYFQVTDLGRDSDGLFVTATLLNPSPAIAGNAAVGTNIPNGTYIGNAGPPGQSGATVGKYASVQSVTAGGTATVTSRNALVEATALSGSPKVVLPTSPMAGDGVTIIADSSCTPAQKLLYDGGTHPVVDDERKLSGTTGNMTREGSLALTYCPSGKWKIE